MKTWICTHAELLVAGVLTAAVIAIAATAYAQDVPLLVEAEKGGIDALTAALVALVTAVAGFFGREAVYRWHGKNGAPERVGWDGAADALARHERQCEERHRGYMARFDEVQKALMDINERLARVEGRLEAAK